MKKILINARHPEEKRVAIVEGQKLTDFYVEVSSAEHLRGNVYKGVITALDRGLQAAFVDFGPEKNGFLPLRDVMPENYRTKTRERNPHIRDVLEKGQELVVQVVRDQRGTKGAGLTNYVSIPGRYLVMIPGNERLSVSRKIEDKETRERLKEAFKSLRAPKGMGFILRTAGADCTAEDLGGDLKYLTRLWNKIKRDAKKATAPCLIYREEDISVRTVRDYLTPDVTGVLVDDLQAYRSVKNFLKMTMPWRSINVTHYKQKKPLFDEYDLEAQIVRLTDRHAYLPSGGYIVIDTTEALTAIDVNSGRSRKSKGIESLALRTNLEAAEEIARQLRLRDIGGLIVIDFIDLESGKNYKKVEELLKKALDLDKAHYDITRISRFGILEMSRERMRTAYFEVSRRKCPACGGEGVVKSPELSAVSALREIHSLASKGGAQALTCRLPVESANYLMNRLRENLTAMEKDLSVQVTVLADPALQPGEHSVTAEGAGEPKPGSEEQKQPGKGRRGRRRASRKVKKEEPPATEKAEAGAGETGDSVSEGVDASGAEPVERKPGSEEQKQPGKGRRGRRRTSRKVKKENPPAAEKAEAGAGESATEKTEAGTGEPDSEKSEVPGAEATSAEVKKKRRPRRPYARRSAKKETPEVPAGDV